MNPFRFTSIIFERSLFISHRLSRSSVSSDASSSRPGSSIKESSQLPQRRQWSQCGNADPIYKRSHHRQPARETQAVSPGGCDGRSDFAAKTFCLQGWTYRNCHHEKNSTRRPPPKKGQLTSKNSPYKDKIFKSKELEDKFNCFYNRLVETSNEESSEVNTSKDDHAMSTDRSTDDRKTDSGKETADTSLSEQPSEDFDAQENQMGNQFVSTTIRVNNARPGPSHYGGFAACAPRNEQQEPRPSPFVHISSENISKTNPEVCPIWVWTFKLFSKQRKAVSDNSLKKISLKNLPHFLRSLSSQSTQNSVKRPICATRVRVDS
ncbi:hypothetical protein CEXT_446881 [Caerostris extrusa]|uniref:Uncharacterized protein n=1 Tax=Caerostris extrusa TaxID=172846 RepID=A0AAV4RRT4_CAEEX|nr:hypothetical protein CEXT_446881 [Caerostris extrusa]